MRFVWRAAARRLDAAALGWGERGQPQMALRLHQLAVRLAAAGFGPGDPRLARVLNNHGVACKSMGRYDEADWAYTQAWTVLAAAFRTDPEMLATLLHNRAGLEHARGRPERGERDARNGLALRECIAGPEHPDVGADLAALAAIIDAQGRLAEADLMYARALAVLERSDESRPLDIAVVLNNRAAIAQRQGRAADAEAGYRRALALKEAVLGHDHHELAQTLNNLALLLKAKGHLCSAESTYRRALRVSEPVLGTAHPTVETYRENLTRLIEPHLPVPQ